jgi:TonB family protein
VNVDECRPKYPPESLKADEQGATVLRMYVTAAGELRGVSLVTSSGSPRLDQAAIDGLGRCRFRPATRAGQPVDASFTLRYAWRIEPSRPAANVCGGAPEYPVESVDAGEQGKVTLHLHIGADGKVQDVRIAASSGHRRLDEAAVDIVRKCTFRSATDSALAETTVEFVWKLEDGLPVAPALRPGPVAPDPFAPKL